MENMQIYVGDESKLVTILSGNALTPREKKQVKISGSITAPSSFIAVRQANEQKGHVLYSLTNGTITYYEDEKDELGTIVSGSLISNPDLNSFKINVQAKRSPKEMASFLKLNRIYFQDKEQNAIIVSALNNFQATITTELEKVQDTRGNSKQLVEKKVLSNTPTKFTLSMPLFVGQPIAKFEVEICIDTTDAGVGCWLESAEMNDLVKLNKDTIIYGELEKITETRLPIIESI